MNLLAEFKLDTRVQERNSGNAKVTENTKGWISSDVRWFVPKKKKPIAYTTRAASDLIVLLSQEYKTIQEVHNAINFDQEAKKVLQSYIDAGYGGQIAKEWFK